MKRRITKWLFIIVLGCSFFTCRQQTVDYELSMRRVEQMLEQYPDSALTLLDSINTEQMNSWQYASYLFLQIQVKHKVYQQQIQHPEDEPDQHINQYLAETKEKYHQESLQKDKLQMAGQRNRLLLMIGAIVSMVSAAVYIFIGKHRNQLRIAKKVLTLEKTIDEMKKETNKILVEKDHQGKAIQQVEQERGETTIHSQGDTHEAESKIVPYGTSKEQHTQTAKSGMEKTTACGEPKKMEQHHTRQFVQMDNTVKDTLGRLLKKKCKELKDQNLKNIGKGKETGSGESVWDILYSMMPHDFEKTIQLKYSQLDKSEVRICCLLYFDLTNKEISFILKFKPNTIHSRRSTIRSKLGIETRGNITTFLEQNLWIGN